MEHSVFGLSVEDTKRLEDINNEVILSFEVYKRDGDLAKLGSTIDSLLEESRSISNKRRDVYIRLLYGVI